MKYDLGIFGQQTLDIDDDIYKHYSIILNQRQSLTALSVTYEMIEQFGIDYVIAYLQPAFMENVDRRARQYLISPDSLIEQFVHHHFVQLAPQLAQYHHIYQTDEFLYQLKLYCIHFTMVEHELLVVLEYGIDRDLSDEVIRFTFNHFGQLVSCQTQFYRD